MGVTQRNLRRKPNYKQLEGSRVVWRTALILAEADGSEFKSSVDYRVKTA